MRHREKINAKWFLNKFLLVYRLSCIENFALRKISRTWLRAWLQTNQYTDFIEREQLCSQQIHSCTTCGTHAHTRIYSLPYISIKAHKRKPMSWHFHSSILEIIVVAFALDYHTKYSKCRCACINASMPFVQSRQV